MSDSLRGQDLLRDQRDRFVAFAFAGADLLIEVARDDTIAYAVGAARRLCGIDNLTMVSHPLAHYVMESDRFTLLEALRRLDHGGRFDSLTIALKGPNGKPVPCLWSGINTHPALNGHSHLAITRLRSAAIAAALDPGPPPGQRIDTEDFVALVEQRITESAQGGDDYALTLLDLSGGNSLSPGGAADFFALAEGYLRAHSVGGTSVGRLRDDKFGVISEHALDRAELARRIGKLAHDVEPEAPAVQVHSASVDIAEAALTTEDITKALVYTVNKFVAEGGEKFTIATLAEGYQAAMDDTLMRVAHFRSVISSDKLLFVFQPIVRLTDWDVHHYEALARIRQGTQTFLPSSFITFAEDVGVVSELDMVVCRRSMEFLRNPQLVPSDAAIAINLSGRSMSNSSFIDALFKLLDANEDVLPRLLFEVTESSEMRNLEEANWVVQKLRGRGCKVCLDDFGAGAAAFQYLRALAVDFVKIDGSYILDAFDTHYGRPFLKAMAGLCRDMKIASIGEMVEDERSISLLREVGVPFAQGFFFSAPQACIGSISLPPKPTTRRRHIH